MPESADPPRGAPGPAPGREPLSDAELRALLGDGGLPGEGALLGEPPLPEEPLAGGRVGNGRSALEGGPAGAEAAGARGAPVLVVSRDEDQVRMLRGVLGGLGHEVAVARNPFSALDHLRLREHAAVVSDFELWAEEGSLLFQRLSLAGQSPPVVFLCASGEAARAARRVGAAQALCRPVSASELARAAASFPRAMARAGGRRPEARPGPEAPPPAPGPGPPRARQRDTEPAGPPAPAIPSPPTGGGWLRFFFEARRSIRPLSSPPERLRAVLRAFHLELGGCPCAVGLTGEEGLEVAARPASLALLDLVGRALGQAVARAAGAGGDLAAGLTPEAAAGRSELRLSFLASGRPAVFVALLDGGPGPAGAPALSPEVPESFLDELAVLLREAAGQDV